MLWCSANMCPTFCICTSSGGKISHSKIALGSRKGVLKCKICVGSAWAEPLRPHGYPLWACMGMFAGLCLIWQCAKELLVRHTELPQSSCTLINAEWGWCLWWKVHNSQHTLVFFWSPTLKLWLIFKLLNLLLCEFLTVECCFHLLLFHSGLFLMPGAPLQVFYDKWMSERYIQTSSLARSGQTVEHFTVS